MEVLATSSVPQAKSRGMGPGPPCAIAQEAGTTRKLRLAHRVEHRRVHGFGRGLARPHHELERREIALAGVDGAGEHGFALPGGGGEAARQHEGLAVHDYD